MPDPVPQRPDVARPGLMSIGALLRARSLLGEFGCFGFNNL